MAEDKDGKVEDIHLETVNMGEKVLTSPDVSPVSDDRTSSLGAPEGGYRLYRQRFVGLAGLVLLNLVAAMGWSWFGPISNNTARDFGITVDQVNWLGNIMSVVYLPTAFLVPSIISRWGLRRCTEVGGVALILASWIRFAGTATSLSPQGAYALLFIGQVFAAIAQPMYQCLGSKYSETWFDTKGRTTATMVVAIANPLGSGLAQLISPMLEDTRKSILLLGIIPTVVTPCVFLIGNAPPTPPTYAASKSAGSLSTLLYAMIGKPKNRETSMTIRERLDFSVILVAFGLLVAASTAFGILTNQDLEPQGYSADQAGFFGASLLFSGIVAAIISAPLFDRVFTYHLALTAKVFAPITGAGWFALIWGVKPNNVAGLYAIMILIGVTSLTILPIALELATEVTGNPDASSALLWALGNAFTIMHVLAQQALRAGPEASPPYNMKKALIFNGVFSIIGGLSMLLLNGDQKRKRLDEQKRDSAQGGLFPAGAGNKPLGSPA